MIVITGPGADCFAPFVTVHSTSGDDFSLIVLSEKESAERMEIHWITIESISRKLQRGARIYHRYDSIDIFHCVFHYSLKH